MGELLTSTGKKIPGTAITNVPIFGGTAAYFTDGSPATANVNGGIFSFASRIRKGTPASYKLPYITNISAPFINMFYNTTRSTVAGSTLKYRRNGWLLYGFITGKGGNGGQGKQNWASWDKGSGGGGGGCVLFWMSSTAQPTVAVTESGGNVTAAIKVNGATVFTLYAYAGGNGGAKYEPGSGGTAKIVDYQGNTWGTNTDVRATAPGAYLVAVTKSGLNGGNGKGWDEYDPAGTITMSVSNTLKTALGISNSTNISWSRDDGQGGASAAPGVVKNGTTTWYGSGAGEAGTGQSAAHYYKIIAYIV